jgi:single-strand DNA-binding protein
VVIFNEGLCKIVEQYLKKGSKVYLEGALQTRKWQDKEGHDKYSTEVVLQGFNSQLTMLDTRGGGGGSAADNSDSDFGSAGPSGGSSSGSSAARERRPAMAGAGKRDDMDDEIPF